MTCPKIPYKSKKQAIRVMHQIQNKQDDKPKPVRAYLCDVCQKWHLTHKEIISQVPYDNQRLNRDEWERLITP